MNQEMAPDVAIQILRLFDEPETQGWDLHAFFEMIAGDDPGRRIEVFDVVDRLVDAGYLESRGADFFTLTRKGREAALSGSCTLSPGEKGGATQ